MTRKDRDNLSQREYIRDHEIPILFGFTSGYIRGLFERDPTSAPKVRKLPGKRGPRLHHVGEMRRWIDSFVCDDDWTENLPDDEE